MLSKSTSVLGALSIISHRLEADSTSIFGRPQLFGQAIAVGEVEDHGPVTEDPVRQETLIENEVSQDLGVCKRITR